MIEDSKKDMDIITFPGSDDLVDVLETTFRDTLEKENIVGSLFFKQPAKVRVIALNGESDALARLNEYDNFEVQYGKKTDAVHPYQPLIISDNGVLTIDTNPESLKSELVNDVIANFSLNKVNAQILREKFKGNWLSLTKKY